MAKIVCKPWVGYEKQCYYCITFFVLEDQDEIKVQSKDEMGVVYFFKCPYCGIENCIEVSKVLAWFYHQLKPEDKKE